MDVNTLFNSFKEKAEALTVKVIRCASSQEAEKAISKEIKESGYKKVVATSLTKIDIDSVKEQVTKDGVDLVTELNRDLVAEANLGISEFDHGIAALGSVVQDATDIYKRLVSALPSTHMAILSTKSIVPTLEDSLELLQKTYGSEIPRYISYITGPSKTADIERVLTIGVHGPGRLIIVCID